MAVYTQVPAEALQSFLARYDVGELVSAKGIAEGVENSNFLLHTESGAFILTLYERRVAPEDLPFFLGLMEHLAGQGLTCPMPVKTRAGASPEGSPRRISRGRARRPPPRTDPAAGKRAQGPAEGGREAGPW